MKRPIIALVVELMTDMNQSEHAECTPQFTKFDKMEGEASKRKRGVSELDKGTDETSSRKVKRKPAVKWEQHFLPGYTKEYPYIITSMNSEMSCCGG